MRSLLFALVLVGCTATIPSGVYRCDATTTCPSDLQCVDHLCYHPGAAPDAAVAPVDGGVDAPATDAFVEVDAAIVCTDHCVTLTITNASGSAVDGMPYTLEGIPLHMPRYGDTVGSIHVGYGSNNQLDLVMGSTQTHPTVHDGDSLVVAVVGQTPTWRVLNEPLGMPMPDTSTARLLDATSDPSSAPMHAVNLPGDAPRFISQTMSDHDFVLANDAHTPLLLTRATGTSTSTLVAAFDPAAFPQNQLYYAFIAGRTDAHLGADDGLRMIVALPGSHITWSLPLVWAVNAADGTVLFCDGTTLLAGVDPGHVVGPFVGTFVPQTLAVYDGRTGTIACGTSDHYDFMTPMAPTGLVSGRVIVAAVGMLEDPTMWGAGGGFEGPPAPAGAMPSTQVITYANLSMQGPVTVGSTDTMNVLAIEPRAASSYEWVTGPDDLYVQFGETPKVFNWDPRSPAAAAMVVTDGTHFAALEVTMPFGEMWTMMIENGRDP